MAIKYQDNQAIFESIIYEDEVISFRDFLQDRAGSEVEFIFSECEDIHFSILQLVIAYKKNYECKYEFGTQQKIYEKFLKGFDISENNCN